MTAEREIADTKTTPSTLRERRVDSVRWRTLARFEENLELPLVILGFVWLGILVVELLYGTYELLDILATAIWIVFILDFAIRLALAPKRLSYVLKNWLTVVALLIPALRVFRIFRAVRIFRAARAARGLRLVRLVTSLNRGFKALGATMGRHAFGYVLLATIMVTFAGAAGIYAFETDIFTTYGAALWWTAMMMTTMGSEKWPKTTEGQVLCLLIALYAFTVFGYVTTTLATFLIGRDKVANPSDELRKEVEALRNAIERIQSSGKP